MRYEEVRLTNKECTVFCLTTIACGSMSSKSQILLPGFKSIAMYRKLVQMLSGIIGIVAGLWTRPLVNVYFQVRMEMKLQ